jgi:hypothetical protein
VYIGKGDVVEARGFNFGIVVTKLSSRPWTHWLEVPWIDYADRGEQELKPGAGNGGAPAIYPLGFGERALKFGCTGDDVKALQRALIRLNYSVGAWGVDGDFGASTESAVKAYQAAKNLKQDGVVDARTRAALEADLPDNDAAQESDAITPPSKGPKVVIVSGGDAFIRSSPTTTGMVKGVAKAGDQFESMGDTSMDGWQSVNHNNEIGWISGKFAKQAG